MARSARYFIYIIANFQFCTKQRHSIWQITMLPPQLTIRERSALQLSLHSMFQLSGETCAGTDANSRNAKIQNSTFIIGFYLSIKTMSRKFIYVFVQLTKEQGIIISFAAQVPFSSSSSHTRI